MLLRALWVLKARRFLRRGHSAVLALKTKKGQWQIADLSIPAPKLRRMVQHIPEDISGDELSRTASLGSDWEDSPSWVREFEYSTMEFENESVVLKRPYKRRLPRDSNV